MRDRKNTSCILCLCDTVGSSVNLCLSAGTRVQTPLPVLRNIPIKDAEIRALSDTSSEIFRKGVRAGAVVRIYRPLSSMMKPEEFAPRDRVTEVTLLPDCIWCLYFAVCLLPVCGFNNQGTKCPFNVTSP